MNSLYRSLYLNERVSSSNLNITNLARKRLNMLIESFGIKDETDFEECIRKMSNLDINHLLELMSQEQLQEKEFVRDQEWFSFMKQIEENYSKYKDFIKDDLHIDNSPFSAFLSPFVSEAIEKLQNGINNLYIKYNIKEELLHKNVLLKFIPQLIEQLYPICYKTIILELNVAKVSGVLKGETAKDRYEYFTQTLLKDKDYIQGLYNEYPVLIRLLITKCEYWSANFLMLLERLLKDLNLISQGIFNNTKIKIINEIKMGAGDSHRKGNTVATITLNNDLTLIYKPRSLNTDVKFQKFITWLNELNQNYPSLYTLKVLDQGEYGWTEFITYKSCTTEKEIENFYWRIGSQLSFLYLMNAVDFHGENIIAHGEYPILIDLESLFHPKIEENNQEKTAFQNARDVLNKSVTATGILPFLMYRTKEGKGVDISALGSTEGQVIPKKLPKIENLERDDMKIVKGHIKLSGVNNNPRLQNKEVKMTDYISQIEDGFRNTYLLLMENKEELKEHMKLFTDCDTRHIVRSTPQYADLLRISYHPDYLRDGIDRDLLLHRLWLEIGNRLIVKEVTESEKLDLLEGDIPYFMTKPGEKHLWDSRNKRIENFFNVSSLDICFDKVNEMSKKECEDQIQVIKLAILATSYSLDNEKYNHYIPLKSNDDISFDKTKFLNEAIRIGEYLKEKSIAGINNGERDLCWIGTNIYGTDEAQWDLSPIRVDLYDGLSGIALFFAYLAHETGRDDFKDVAIQALVPVRGALKDINTKDSIIGVGAFTGITSTLYSLSHISALWKDSTILSEVLPSISYVASSIEQDKDLDIIGGVAGAAVVFKNIYEQTNNEEVLKAAILCGNHLIEKATPEGNKGGVGWRGVDENALSGFSHGSAGIIWALAELYDLTKDTRFLETLKCGLIYERELFVNDKWQDMRAGARPAAAAWCHGAPGITLGRLLLKELEINDPLLDEEICKGIYATVQQGFGRNHSLCHGDFGNLEIIRYAGKIYHNKEWIEIANNASQHVLNEIKLSGWQCGIPGMCETPGLMTGLSGIGLSLLQCYNPIGIPSILWLQSSKALARV